MCDKAILENGKLLNSVFDCYKDQEMCNKAVDNYPDALEFVPDHVMTEKKCVLAFFIFLINIKLTKCVKKLFLVILFN